MTQPKPTTLTFNSYGEFLEAAQAPAVKEAARNSHQPGRLEFMGTDSFEAAVALARQGWTQGAARAQELRARLDGTVRDVVAARKASYGYDVTGDVVDVGKYLGGLPECFLTTVEEGESTSGRIVRIVANVAASGSVSAESLFVRGAVIFATVDILEALGHRVELTVARGTRAPNGSVLQVFVPVKGADQPLDADRLAFTLCHPSFLRRLTWSVGEQHGFIPNVTRPCPVEAPEGSILTHEALRGKDFTESQLEAEVLALCSECGVEIETCGN